MKITHAMTTTALSIVLAITLTSTADSQPTSTVTSGLFYTPYQGDTPLTLSTAEVPTGNCPNDRGYGDPTYYWDFGPDLDGTDNKDGTFDGGAPDTATIATDKAGTYNVTVYCTEWFLSDYITPDNTHTYPMSTVADTTP